MTRRGPTLCRVIEAAKKCQTVKVQTASTLFLLLFSFEPVYVYGKRLFTFEQFKY